MGIVRGLKIDLDQDSSVDSIHSKRDKDEWNSYRINDSVKYILF